MSAELHSIIQEMGAATTQEQLAEVATNRANKLQEHERKELRKVFADMRKALMPPLPEGISKPSSFGFDEQVEA